MSEAKERRLKNVELQSQLGEDELIPVRRAAEQIIKLIKKNKLSRHQMKTVFELANLITYDLPIK